VFTFGAATFAGRQFEATLKTPFEEVGANRIPRDLSRSPASRYRGEKVGIG
jgi:hypothetical protein